MIDIMQRGLEAIDSISEDPQLEVFHRKVGELMIPGIEEISGTGNAYGDISPIRRYQGDEQDIRSLIDSAVVGLRRMDRMLDDLLWVRSRLVESLLRMRHAYLPRRYDRVRELASAEKYGWDYDFAKKALGELLGRELPEEIINVSVRSDDTRMLVSFDVAGTATSVRITMPVEVDWRRCAPFEPDMRGMGMMRLDNLECMADLRIRMDVRLGGYMFCDDYASSSSRKDEVKAYEIADYETLSRTIDEVLSMDIRDQIEKVEDILDVKSVDDFVAWRALRRANAAAERSERIRRMHEEERQKMKERGNGEPAESAESAESGTVV